MPFTFRLGLALLVLVATGCLPAATLTSARPIPRGELEHVVSLHGSTAMYPDRTDMTGFTPTYDLRYGATERLEVGGRVSMTSLEANLKVGLLRTRWFALAIAPRLAATGPFVPALYARAPLLATLQVTEWATLTPRAGLGYVAGRMLSWGGSSDFGPRLEDHVLNDPLVEAGGTLLFRLSPNVSLGLDGYGLWTFLDDSTSTGGGGVAILFTPRQETQR